MVEAGWVDPVLAAGPRGRVDRGGAAGGRARSAAWRATSVPRTWAPCFRHSRRTRRASRERFGL